MAALSGRSPRSVFCATAGAAAIIIRTEMQNPATTHRTIFIIRRLQAARPHQPAA